MNKKRRISGLDGLRVISLIAILLYHTFPTKFPGGYIGVITFFVISGYLSAVSIINALQTKHFNILKHYGKRIKRLYPSLIIVILITIAVLTKLDPYRLANTQEEVKSILLGYNNHWQIQMNGDYFANITNNSPFTHLWYIAILLQFELIVPLLGYLVHLLGKKDKALAIITLQFVTLLTFFVMPLTLKSLGTTVVYYATYTRIFSLLAGFTLGTMHAYKARLRFIPRKNPTFANLFLLAYVVVTVVFTLFVPGTMEWVYYFGMALYTLFTVLVIEVLVKNPCFMRRILNHPVFQKISQYSYEIYLWQFPVLFIFGIASWNTSNWFYLLQIIIIILLSIWTNIFQRVLFFPFKKQS